jgi:hypothetical protein
MKNKFDIKNPLTSCIRFINSSNHFKLYIMKKVISFFLFVFMSISIISAQTVKEKKDPVGQWKFEAPAAPEGYTSGTINIGFAERKYSTTMEFAGIEYKFIGENVKFKNDSLFFSFPLEDDYVSISLKLEDKSKMSGKGIYSEGVVLLILTRSEAGTK